MGTAGLLSSSPDFMLRVLRQSVTQRRDSVVPGQSFGGTFDPANKQVWVTLQGL